MFMAVGAISAELELQYRGPEWYGLTGLTAQQGSTTTKNTNNIRKQVMPELRVKPTAIGGHMSCNMASDFLPLFCLTVGLHYSALGRKFFFPFFCCSERKMIHRATAGVPYKKQAQSGHCSQSESDVAGCSDVLTWEDIWN